MAINIEHINETTKKIQFEIPSETVETEIAKALESIRTKARIPGFRPGKAPMSIIEKRYGKEVEGETVEKLISEAYQSAIKETGLIPIAPPVLAEPFQFKRNEGVSITFTVEVRPKLEGLKYEGYKVKDIPVEVSDDEIEKTLARLQEERATYDPSDDAVGDGDIVVYDMTAEGQTHADQIIKIGHEMFPVEISTALAGKKKDDSAKVSVPFPAHFNIKELAGKSTESEMKIKEVKKAILPPMDDELAKELNFDSLEALKTHLKAQTLKMKSDTVQKIQKADILKQIIEAHQFDAPESLVKRELDNMVDEAKTYAAESGNPIDAEAYRKEMQSRAVRNVKSAVIIDAIGEKEKVDVTEEDMKKELMNLSLRHKMSPENVIKYYVTRDGSLDGLRHSVYEEKVLSLLLEKAIIEKEG